MRPNEAISQLQSKSAAYSVKTFFFFYLKITSNNGSISNCKPFFFDRGHLKSDQKYALQVARGQEH